MCVQKCQIHPMRITFGCARWGYIRVRSDLERKPTLGDSGLSHRLLQFSKTVFRVLLVANPPSSYLPVLRLGPPPPPRPPAGGLSKVQGPRSKVQGPRLQSVL
jgi:hypothetical protein